MSAFEYFSFIFELIILPFAVNLDVYFGYSGECHHAR